MQQLFYGLSVCSPLVFQGGLELKENIYIDNLTHPKLLDRFNLESKSGNNGRMRSWGMPPNAQHFGGRGMCWSSGMGTMTSEK